MPGRLREFHEKFLVEHRDISRRERQGWLWLAVALVAIGAATFGVLLADIGERNDLALMDAPLANWLRSTRSPEVTPLMIAFAVVFGPIVLSLIVLTVTVTWGILSRHAWRPVVLALGTLAAVVAVRIAAELVQRSRPPIELMIFGPDTSYSFPSGHVVGAAEFGLLASYLVFSRSKRQLRAILAMTVTVAVVILLGVSRVYLGYHWATDVLASVALALAILGCVVAIDTFRTTGMSPSRSRMSAAAGRNPGETSGS